MTLKVLRQEADLKHSHGVAVQLQMWVRCGKVNVATQRVVGLASLFKV